MFVVLSAYLPIVPLLDKFSIGPNVFPLSVLIFITGISAVWFVSPHVATTLLASDSIPTLVESEFGVLLDQSFSKSLSLIYWGPKHYFVISCFVSPPCYIDVVTCDSWRGFSDIPAAYVFPANADCFGCSNIGVTQIPIIVDTRDIIIIALKVNSLFIRVL